MKFAGRTRRWRRSGTRNEDTKAARGTIESCGRALKHVRTVESSDKEGAFLALVAPVELEGALGRMKQGQR